MSLRSSNRNFEGRAGTADAQVYLVSPETAAASAILGRIAGGPELEARVRARLHRVDADALWADALVVGPVMPRLGLDCFELKPKEILSILQKILFP